METPFPSDLTAKFKIERRLAAGGFGSVYLATQIALNRPAAVKLLDATGSGDDAVQRFLEEARVTASLAHSNIVIVLDFGYDLGVPWIAYEYLEGGTLRDRVDRGPLPVNEAVAAAVQVSEALQAAHDRGILHRDVKPDNVFALPGGRFKIADFGIAKLTQSSSIHTKTGVIMGTPAYVAPEQIQGKPSSPSTDVYSTGVLLYELITGRPPFLEATLVNTLAAHIEQEPVRPGERVPGLPPALDDAILRALAKDPADRFATSEGFAAALIAAVGLEASQIVTRPAARTEPPPSGRSGALREDDVTRPITRGASRGVPQPRARVPSAKVGAAAPDFKVRAPARRLGSAVLAAGVGAALCWAAFVRLQTIRPTPPSPAPSATASSLAVTGAPAHQFWVGRLLTTDVAARIEVFVRPSAQLTVALCRSDQSDPIASRPCTPDASGVRLDFLGLAPSTAYRFDVGVANDPARYTLRFQTRRPNFRARYARELKETLASGGERLFEGMGTVPWLGGEMDLVSDFQSAEKLGDSLTADDLSNDIPAKHMAWLSYQMRSAHILQHVVETNRVGYFPGVSLDLASSARRLGLDDLVARLAPTKTGEDTNYSLSEHVLCLALRDRAKAFAPILSFLGSTTPPDERAMAEALETADPESAQKLFASWLEQPGATAHPGIALLALGLADTPASIANLLHWLDRPNLRAFRAQAARALVEAIEPTAREGLIERGAAHTNDPSVVWDLARATLGAGPAQSARVSRAFRLALSTPGTPVDARAAVLAASGLLDDRSLDKKIADAVADPDPLIASAAAWAIGRRHDRTALAQVRVLLRSERDVYGAAAWAVSELEGPAALADLVGAIDTLPAGAVPPEQIARAGLLALMLARIDPGAAQPLFERLARQDGAFAKGLHDLAHSEAKARAQELWLFPFVGYDSGRTAALEPVIVEIRDAWVTCKDCGQSAPGVPPRPMRTSLYAPRGWFATGSQPEEYRPPGDLLVSSVDAGAGVPLGTRLTTRLRGVQRVRIWPP